MKAIYCTAYGPPEVLQIREIDIPVPKPNEVRIKIHATAVTASDCIVRGFKLSRWSVIGIMMRLVIGFRKPRNPILGMVLAGEVEAVGKNVTRFQKGDYVFGSTLRPNRIKFGAYAEYVCLSEKTLITTKPANVTFEQAAAVPYGAGLAWYYLKRANIQPGQKVLIYGASGAIGTNAVQLAKYLDAEVTGVCSTRNLELVKSLGADHVLDYTDENATVGDERYDFVLDAVGKAKHSKLKFEAEKALAPNGKATSVDEGNPGNEADDMLLFGELMESGKLKAVIDRCYPLEEMVEAHRYVDQGHKKGNVVITVAHKNGTRQEINEHR
jgi:NADPH:quinone reductase-like Zn-dependent oxidoreductase